MSNEKNKKAMQWVEESTNGDNKEDLLLIGGLGAKAINDKLQISINDDEYLGLCIYCSIIQTAIDVLVSKTAKNKEFEINLGNRLQLSFANDDCGEDVEKMGNFMIYLKHINLATVTNVDEEEGDGTLELCAKWNAANIIQNTATAKEIADRAKEMIHTNSGAKLAKSEIIIPMFGIMHDCLITFGKIKLAECNIDKYELNVVGIFEITFEAVDGEDPIIYYTPQPSAKLQCKNDSKALEQQQE